MSEPAPRALGEYVGIKHGFAFKGEHFTGDATSDVLVTPGNVAVGGGFQGEKLKFYNGPVPEEYVLEPGALVVTMTDLSKAGDTLGYPALVPNSPGKRYLHNQRIGLVEPRANAEIDKRYLFYRLCAQDYRHHVLATASGSTVRHTSPGRICDFVATMPPIAEQRDIASVLGALDDKIEHNRRTVRALERLARAIFRAWFVDFEPVRAKAAGATAFPPMPQPVFNALPTRFVDSDIGSVPEGWEVEALDNVADFLNGLALQKYPPRGDSTDLPVIKIAQLRKGSTEGADASNDSVDEKYKIQDGDLLFSWSGTLEAVLWFGGPGALNQHIFRVISHDYPQWIIYEWIQQYLPEFRLIAASKATTMGHIKRGHLSQALIAVPPPDLLKEGDLVLAPLFKSLANTQLESRKLAEMRDYLLPKLLGGDVRIDS